MGPYTVVKISEKEIEKLIISKRLNYFPPTQVTFFKTPDEIYGRDYTAVQSLRPEEYREHQESIRMAVSRISEKESYRLEE